MRRFIISFAVVALLATPLSAQSESTPDTDAPESSKSLIEEGVRLFFEGLLKEAHPAIRDMRELAEKLGPQLRSFAEEMGPALAEILRDVEDLSVYEAPEMLPNGDIIIRRKPSKDTPKVPERPDLSPPDSSGDIEI